MQASDRTRKFIIATHGTLAAGIKSSLDIIIGAMENVFLIQAYVDENSSIEADLKAILEQVGDEDDLVIFSDILGGSVTNQMLQHALRPNVYIVSGFNLPLVIEIMMADTDRPLNEIIEESIANAKEQMVFVNKLLTAENNEDQDD
jgi:fructoselysine and glucoselysine-specific PTS system IIA component